MEIVPFLFLGNELDSQQMKVDMVVNCTKSIPFTDHIENTLKIRIAVEDNGHPEEITKLYTILKNGEIIRSIESYLKSGKTVLVHCKMGQQRSAATVAAFIMYSMKLNPFDAINFVQSKKRDAFFYRPNFLHALNLLYADRQI